MITHVSAGHVSFIPKEWRRLSDAQELLLVQCIRTGPQVVMRKTQRTAQVLFRRGLVEYPDFRGGYAHEGAGYVHAGIVIRASGQAWELYREFQRLQGYGDAYVKSMRNHLDPAES